MTNSARVVQVFEQWLGNRVRHHIFLFKCKSFIFAFGALSFLINASIVFAVRLFPVRLMCPSTSKYGGLFAFGSNTTILDFHTMEAACALKGGKTLSIVAHRISTVDHGDYLYRIKGGRMVEEGKPALLLSKKSQIPIK